MRFKIFNAKALILLFLFACQSNHEGNKEMNESQKDETVEVQLGKEENPFVTIEKNGLKLYTAPSQIEYPKAKLSLKTPSAELTKAGKTTFEFIVSDYTLATQTNAQKKKILANSEKGQHIHFLLNNAPYQAKYEPVFEAEMLEGNNVVLAFLSKSFHESVKTPTAFFFKNFYIGEGDSFFKEDAAHLFYSRPKGTYKKEESEKILFDFYLLNTDLSPTGNRVKLTVDDVEFMIPHWNAYFIEGLTVGKHEFRIQLIDQDGNLIDGPFNDSGIREIEITE